MKTTMTILAVTALLAGGTTFAQPMPADSGHMPIMPMQGHMKNNARPFPRPMPPKRAPAPRLPSAEQLQRMLPPEPPTEESIKNRFAEQRAQLEETLERDRKAAEQYAKDFDRMQKYQAEQLAKVMARAEQGREAMLERLDRHEQRMLERFRQRSQAAEPPRQNGENSDTAEESSEQES